MKERIDVLMVERGLVASRERAQAFLMAGSVSVDGMREMKAGTRVSVDAEIALAEDPVPYVSRGGLKLRAALDHWGVDLAGAVCIDIGASTGGFTDLMLERGAARVYAIDVGYGQLDYKLRNDPRVVNMERTNIRLLDVDGFPERAGFIAIDVSFISLGLVLPVAVRLLGDKPSARIVALVKPQFEAGREQVGKGGIVRDPAVHKAVVEKVKGVAENQGMRVLSVLESPILGTKGNKEYLLIMQKNGNAEVGCIGAGVGKGGTGVE
ncbi:MAG: TlyA family RNA methyltransferase [Clostridiales bacterium]|nr:TlyA family RNA methyltransferase [Clostridiales bacterium]